MRQDNSSGKPRVQEIGKDVNDKKEQDIKNILKYMLLVDHQYSSALGIKQLWDFIFLKQAMVKVDYHWIFQNYFREIVVSNVAGNFILFIWFELLLVRFLSCKTWRDEEICFIMNTMLVLSNEHYSRINSQMC